MIDRKALEALIKQHAYKMEDSPTVELHLANGDVFYVQRFDEFYDNFCVAVIYSQEPSTKKSNNINLETKGQKIFDRVILSYGFIAYVRLTLDEPGSQKRFIGFVDTSLQSG